MRCSHLFAMCLIGTALSLSGCGGAGGVEKGDFGLKSYPLKATTPAADADADSALAAALASSSSPLSFGLAVGGIEGGTDLYQVVRVDADGSCTYNFPTQGPARQVVRKTVSFALSPEEIRGLKDTLARNRFWQLASRYDADVADGATVFLRCALPDRSQVVACNNHFPDEVVRIHDYVWQLVLQRHANEVKNATPSSPDSGVDALLQDSSTPRSGE